MRARRLGAAATDLRAERTSGDCTADGGHVLAAAAADLVAENAADYRAGDCARHVRVVFTPFDPASLLRRSDDRVHRRDRRLEQPLTVATGVIAARHVSTIVVVPIVLDGAHRRNAVAEPHGAERRIIARPQHRAPAFEARVFAHLPVAAANHGG